MTRTSDKTQDRKPLAAAHTVQRREGQGALRRMSGPGWVRPGTRPGGPVQLQRAAELKPGAFNMIGETHSDYGGKKGRSLEAKKIRAVMGPSVEYLTENMLKTSPGNNDYADPVDLRVAQIVSFVRLGYENLLPQMDLLKGMDIRQSAIVDNGDKEASAGAVARFAPLIARDTFDLNAVMEAIRTENYSIAVLAKLHESDTWKAAETKHDPTGAFADNFNDVIDHIMEEKFAREDAVDGDAQPADPLAPLVIAKAFAIHVKEFYEQYRNKLPGTLALYYHIAGTKEFAGKKNKFHFATDKIQEVITQWEKLGEAYEIIKIILSQNHDAFLATVVENCSRLLPALMSAIDAGTSGAPGSDLLKIVEQRSIAMSQAAESLKDKNIAWKVGSMHVEDIDKAEKAGLMTTGYVYLTKGDFKTKYPTTERELEEHVASDEHLGVSYLAAKEEKKRLVALAREKLAKVLPWAGGSFAAIEHLDLGNLWMNGTAIIADALEKGALPKLKTLKIYHKSMTPDLMGRFTRFGVKVTLT